MAKPRYLLRAGYDFEILRLFTNDTGSGATAEDLSAATLIEACVKNYGKTAELITDTTQTNTGSASWSTGIVAIRFTAAQTTGLVAQSGWIEVAVVLAGTRIRYEDIPVDIEAGFLS